MRTRRRPFALRVGGVDAAEVALDDTMIVVGNGQRPMQLRRVEVEVQPEWLDALEPIVEQLRVVVRAPAGAASPSSRPGCSPSAQEIPGPPDLGPTEVSASRPPWASSPSPCCGASSPCCATRSPGPGSGEDPEELHDMRVATRRLRAALALFASVLPVRAQIFREELGWLGRLLGAVRDLDVQLEGLADMTGAPTRDAARGRTPASEHDPLADLAALLEREREAARADMLSGLDSVRWDRLAKGLAAMAQQGPARRSLATRVPAVIGVPELVRGASRRGRQGGEAGQAVGRRGGLPPPAHPLQATALRPRVQRRGLRGPHDPLRARS